MGEIGNKVLNAVLSEGNDKVTFSIPIRKIKEDIKGGAFYAQLFLLKMKAREYADSNYGSVGYEGLTEIGKAEHEGLMCGWIEACETIMEMILEKE